MSESRGGSELDVKALAAHVERELQRFEVPGVEVVVVLDGAGRAAAIATSQGTLKRAD
jgi:hypothetical protein